MWFDPDTDVRIGTTTTDRGKPITTYRDDTGEYPALSECIRRIP